MPKKVLLSFDLANCSQTDQEAVLAVLELRATSVGFAMQRQAAYIERRQIALRAHFLSGE